MGASTPASALAGCRADYDHAGLAFDPPGTRIARLDEAARILRRSWEDDTVTFSGEHYRTDGLVGRALLGGAPRPRLVMGGGGPRMLEVAATHADIVSVNVRLESGSLGPERGVTATEAITADKIDIVRRAAGAPLRPADPAGRAPRGPGDR